MIDERPDGPETWAAFQAQPTTAQWGQYVQISAPARREALTRAYEGLCTAVTHGAWRRGYVLDPARMVRTLRPPTADLLTQFGAMGIKGFGDLAPEPQQFLVWAEAVVAAYRAEASRMQTLQTWRGFLRFQWQRAVARVVRWLPRNADDDDDA